MNNHQKIITMSPEELADLLIKLLDPESENHETIGCYDCTLHNTHHYPNDCGVCWYKDGILDWLHQPVDHERSLWK